MAKMLGKYEIIRSLGSGAMGEVYLAHQGAIGRDVAIKTILPNVAKGEDAEGRFRREAEAAGKLSHPNLVTIFDFDKDQDVLFLVMEFVKGDDLEDLIRDRALSHAQFLDVLAQVCDGLSHAHRNGIIHRDIKPANVRVIRDGRNLLAKIMDFGIARVEDSNMTATGIVMGTVSYMAPEYIRGGGATHQSDLFAVGVMLYECLTGRKPFPGDNTTTILFKIVSEAPAPIELEAIQGISPSIRNVLDKALAKTPGERFATAEEFAKALRACKDPSWTGTLDEATAMISRHATPPPDPDGTRLLAAPTLAEGLPPSQAKGLPPARATELLPPPPAPVPGRAGLYVTLAASALVVLGGGAWFALKPRAAALPPPEPPPLVAGMEPRTLPVASTPPSPVPRPDSQPEAQAASPRSPQAPKAEAQKPDVPRADAPRAGLPRTDGPKAEAPGASPSPVRTLAALVDADPRQAAVQARQLAAADPGNAEVQGLYLAALYRSRNAWDFERALSRATASGVTVKGMLGAAPAFRAALAEESRLRKAKPPAGLLSEEAMGRILAGL